jgi:hypothetical protein
METKEKEIPILVVKPGGCAHRTTILVNEARRVYIKESLS